MATRLEQAPWVRGPLLSEDARSHSDKWMRVWVAIGILVVLVVIGYLVGITSALDSIDGNLAGVIRQVGGADADVRPLPAHVERANTSLAGIDRSLKAIPGQADTIGNALDRITRNLTTVDGSLVNTANVLDGALGTARSIDSTLEAADDPADGSGVQEIWRRVARINGVLSLSASSAKKDLGNIIDELVGVNVHLKSICTSVRGNC